MSLTNVREGMRAFSLGRHIVTLLTVIVGLLLWAYSALDNALNYTAVKAEVVRVEDVCYTPNAATKITTNCAEAQARSGGRRVTRRKAVYIRYTSPADGQVHDGIIIPVGGKKAVSVSQLRPGDRWEIMAHDDKPEDVKAE
jgi:hypothetical protein